VTGGRYSPQAVVSLEFDFLVGDEERLLSRKPAILTIQRLSAADFTTLENPGFRSVQIVWPNNAPEARVTITRVSMDPGAAPAMHMHPASEQIWLVEQGNALLKMADGQTDELGAGDVVRTPAGTIHGVTNAGGEPFVYLAVTTPPQDFSLAYKGRRTSSRP
jgi:mannose-6-phosphate isomerase-like protein (cupin superfamily)